MKLSIVPILLGAALLIGASDSNAGMFGDLKDKLKKKTKKEAVTEIKKKGKKSHSKKTAGAAGASTLSLNGGPDAKLIKFTKCTVLKPTNIMVGNVGSYTFQEGFNEEQRTGLINRKTGKLTKGCIAPSLMPRQTMYMEVDEKQFKAIGDSNDWKMQCVRSDNPGAGSLDKDESKTEYAYPVNQVAGKEMMLHCGHSVEGVSECAEGSNSSRSGKWKKKLQKEGKILLSVFAKPSLNAPKGGEKLFCQYYNKKARKSLYAFEYIREHSS
jgi:hypothetical protein